MKRLFTAILILVALPVSMIAQNITGRVVDENESPLAYANVIVQRADSTYIDGTITPSAPASSI